MRLSDERRKDKFGRIRCSCGCLYFTQESVTYCMRRLHLKGKA